MELTKMKRILIAATCFNISLSVAVADRAPQSREVKPFHYTVRTGDTPSELDERLGIPASLVAAPGHTIRVGEVLTIPLAARVKIHRGDTLSALGQKYGVTVETLAKFNRVVPPYKIRSGRTILVPAVK